MREIDLSSKIVRLGHPALRARADSVNVEELSRGDFKELISTLEDTLRTTGSHCIAAPQVGAGLQVLVFRRSKSGNASDKDPLIFVANPMIEPEHGDLVYDWEDCLSIPKILGLVPRHPVVRVRGVDKEGQPIDFQAEGQEARIIQHANDHLSGVVFLDRMRDLRSLSFDQEWKEFLLESDS